MDERTKWDARFSRPGYLFGDRPRAFLRENAPHLPARGRALDVACGEGQNAIFLAQRGLDVTGVDVSPVALTKARQLAQGADLTPGSVLWLERDLQTWRPEPKQWNVVFCGRYLQRELIPALRDALAPGGVLCIELLTQLDPAEGPPARYRTAANELLRWADGLHVAYYREGAVEGIGLSQLVATAPMDR